MSRKIETYTHISTKKGDGGTSRNYSNDELPKTDILFETLGVIDELSSALGLASHYSRYDDYIRTIQLDLQHINSLIATRADDPRRGRLTVIDDETIERLEAWEQSILTECRIEPRFVLPGSESSKEGAYLDLARAISRRVERTVLRCVASYQRKDLDDVIRYVNRLSDLLFIMARSCDQ